jgi:hypothetical protein
VSNSSFSSCSSSSNTLSNSLHVSESSRSGYDRSTSLLGVSGELFLLDNFDNNILQGLGGPDFDIFL